MEPNATLFKHTCSNLSSPRPENREGVPADSTIHTYIHIDSIVSLRVRKNPLRGHPPVNICPLPQPGAVLKHWDNLYPVLRALLHSPKQAEMVKKSLWLQAMRGVSFASARYLGAAGLGSEKTWDRALANLRKLGLVDTWRTIRSNGDDSVNLIDLRKLWAMLLQLIQTTACRVQIVRRRAWVKIHGAWAQLEMVLSPAESSSA